MIEEARKDLTELGMIDKFELVCADIFDEKFALQEKVDVVVICYTLCTFINSYDMLAKILEQCCKYTKNDGFMLVTDFCHMEIPQSLFPEIGFWISCNQEKPDKFDTFRFHIEENDKGASYEIFNIPSYVMFQAGKQAGFNSIELKGMYANPEHADNKVI